MAPQPAIIDPNHPAMNGKYRPGSVSRIDYHREIRKPWEAVEIFLTMRCPLACRHCVTNSHPKRGERMERGLLESLLAGLAPLGTRYVCLFGGEPTLEPELLTIGVARSRALGMLPSAVTSGTWAANDDSFCDSAARLFIGMNAVLVSTDRAHQQFLPIPQTLRAVRALKKLNINVSVCYAAEPDEFTGQTPLPADLTAGARNLGAGIVVTPISDAGRAAGRGQWVTPVQTHCGCGKIDVPLIGCDGDVYACGPGWTIPDEATSRHRLGRFPDVSLQELRRRSYDSSVFSAIREEGAISLLESLAATNEALAEELRTAPPISPCSACQMLVRHLPESAWWTVDEQALSRRTVPCA
jgi:hypothetical protein